MNSLKPDHKALSLILEVVFDEAFVLEHIEQLRGKYSDSKEAIPQPTKQQIEDVCNCCVRLYNSFNGIFFYPNLQDRCAGLIININKGHYLHNGNKRVSLLLLIMLLTIESLLSKEYRFIIENKDFISVKNIILKVAKSVEEIKKENQNGSTTKENQLKEYLSKKFDEIIIVEKKP